LAKTTKGYSPCRFSSCPTPVVFLCVHGTDF
jgi:hypothetical protein